MQDATQRNVALDILAIVADSDEKVGSESTFVETVEQKGDSTFTIILDNGQTFEVRVREILV